MDPLAVFVIMVFSLFVLLLSFLICIKWAAQLVLAMLWPTFVLYLVFKLGAWLWSL